MAHWRFWFVISALVLFRFGTILPGDCVRDGKVVSFCAYGTPGETPRWINVLRCKGKYAKPSSNHENLKKLFSKMKHGGAMLAMITGDRSLLSFSTKNMWRESGLSHLLVISGQHLSILVGALLLFFSVVRYLCPFWFARMELYRFYGLILSPFIWFYAIWTGMSAGTLRAAVMLSIFFVTKALFVRMALWQWGLLTILIILLIDPAAALDPALHLSGSAAGGIIFFMRWFRQHVWWKKLYLATIGATAGVMPFSAYYFGVIPLFGWLASLIISPLMIVVLPALAVAVFLGEFGMDSIALWLLQPVDLIFAIFEKIIINPISSHNLSMLAISVGGVPELLILVLFIWRCIFLFSKREIFRGIAVLLTGFLILSLLPAIRSRISKRPHSLQWTTLSVGQGESLLLRFPGGKTMLVDGGGQYSNSFDPGGRLVLPALHYMGVKQIDYLVISHPDLDHIKGLFAIVERFPVNMVWAIESSKEAPLFNKFLALLEKYKIPVSFAPPQKIHIDGVDVHVFYSNNDSFSKNNNSLVMRLKHKNVSFLLTGDIESKREFSMIGGALSSTVLKVPHHGSKNSSSNAFISSVKPKIAIASAGYHNPYHHPHEIVRSRYRDMGIPFLVTSEVGSVQVETDGVSTSLRCFSPRIGRWSLCDVPSLK